MADEQEREFMRQEQRRTDFLHMIGLIRRRGQAEAQGQRMARANSPPPEQIVQEVEQHERNLRNLLQQAQAAAAHRFRQQLREAEQNPIPEIQMEER